MTFKHSLAVLLLLTLTLPIAYLAWAETKTAAENQAPAATQVPDETAQAPVQKWKPIVAQSHINFTGTYEGKLFAGHFSDFDADIVFDPKRLDKSSLLVVIETTSVKLDDDLLNSSVTGSNWLNVRNFPQAVFKSSRIDLAYASKDGLNQYSATGKFSLGGVESDFVLPFVVKFVKSNAYAYGEFPIKRMDYGIGASVDPNGGMVGADILVKFDIVAAKFEPIKKPTP